MKREGRPCLGRGGHLSPRGNSGNSSWRVTYHSPHPAAAVQALLLNWTLLCSDHSSRPLCCTRGSNAPLHFIPVALSAPSLSTSFFRTLTCFSLTLFGHWAIISMPWTDLKRNFTSHIIYFFISFKGEYILFVLKGEYILLQKLSVEMKLFKFSVCLIKLRLINVHNITRLKGTKLKCWKNLKFQAYLTPSSCFPLSLCRAILPCLV